VQEDRQVECPCHGSRYASDGAVINPPAVVPLSSYPASLDAAGNVVVDLAPGDGIFPPVQNGVLTLTLANFPALGISGGAVLGHPQGHAGPVIVARLASGAIVAFDGTCTHLACTVHPAQAGVLHCPCHGSRFSVSPDLTDPQHLQPEPGWVLNGPASVSLGTFPVSLSSDGATATITFASDCP
jgi:Rieske Fe-S protein